MLVVRGTKKLRDRVKGSVSAADDDVSTGVLGDWFATALFWKPQVALAVNARTFLPVFMPLAPAGMLLERLPDEIARILALHGVDPAAIDAEREQMADVRIAPTNDRSVVGVMTEFAFLDEHFFEGDLTALSLRMAGTPVGPLRSTYNYPDRALAALLVEPSWGPSADEHMARIIPFPGQETAHAAAENRSSSAPTVRSGSPGSVYQLKVSLLDTKPPIWRRILVDGSTTLDGLHEIVQAAFGWWNCHLHEFEIGRSRYGVPDPDWDFGPPTVDERTTRLDAVAGEDTSFHYTYDFGDNWRHKITVEKITPADLATSVPDCIGGRRACPPTAADFGATRTCSTRSPVAPDTPTLDSTTSAPTSTRQHSIRATSRSTWRTSATRASTLSLSGPGGRPRSPTCCTPAWSKRTTPQGQGVDKPHRTRHRFVV